MSISSASAELTLSTEAQDLIFRRARTANTFTAEPVTDEQVLSIMELVRWAPTSGNVQPLRVTVLRTDEAKARLIPLLNEGNRAKTASAPVVAVLSADLDFHVHMDRLMPYLEGASDYFENPVDRRHRSAEFNAVLQAAYFILGVRAAGLAAGPMLGYDAAAIDSELFPGGRQRTVLVVNIGRPGPGAWMDRLPRLRPEETVRFL
ncbi:malonic semialdehyde reductase [Nocardioides humi]|uniref:Malonic semialdehyde reductase n=1 Tax=Nocardioides humi TaxID=449461 RepID=A0ABN2A3X1_9ACTN|nr:malonic semialdehyde reductase [Nocardioides humi]